MPPTHVLERPARRAGWLLLAFAGAAAALAFCDPAALSQTTAYADDGRLRLEYSRLDRAIAPTRLRLWVAPGLAEDGVLRVRLNAAYRKGIEITRIKPAPERVESSGGEVVFVFRAPSVGDASVVEFEVKAGDLGRYDGRLAVAGDRAVDFTQYMVP